MDYFIRDNFIPTLMVKIVKSKTVTVTLFFIGKCNEIKPVEELIHLRKTCHVISFVIRYPYNN